MNSEIETFEIEHIENEHKLFYRVHKVNIDFEISDPIKKIKPSAFNPQPVPHSVEMSVNWEKYSTALETKMSAKKPPLNGVISFITYDIRNAPINLNVTHRPTKNQAHSIVHKVVSAKNDPEIRLNLRNACTWEISL